MINFIKRKIERSKLKRIFKEYGFQVKTFNLSEEGEINYAQWLHPYEQPKIITQSMVNFYKKYAKTGSLVIDIGAHTGDTSVPMAIAIGNQGTLLALEPNPFVFKILQKNSELNKNKGNIIALNFAATDSEGEFKFNYSDASYCNGGYFDKIKSKRHRHKYVLNVKGKNLETFLMDNYSSILSTISLIKVDAEGYDKEILKSISSILVKYKPNIISECNKNLTAIERKELFEIIDTLGYNLFKINEFDENYTTIQILNPGEMTKWSHFDLVAIPR